MFLHLFMCMLFLEECRASTHWIVTEDGRIQAQMDSVFNMRRPYDLVALMEQEKRAVLIEELKEQLVKQKQEIDRREDQETDLETKFRATDEDCITAGKPLAEFGLYASTAVPGRIYEEYREAFNVYVNTMDRNVKLRKPDCTKVIDLGFSMHAFEHLTGVRHRDNLTMPAEPSVQKAVTDIENIELYGYLVSIFLNKNKTSWILYNMAAYYWRIHGDAANAMECVRRALHFTPKRYKFISLINMGNILHLSNRAEEAAIVVHAAVDISPQDLLCHITLGDIYAALGEYNKSLHCFQMALKVNPTFTNAVQRLHALKCTMKLQTVLDSQHLSLQKTLDELREYQKQHEFWVKQHEKLLSEQASPDVKLEQRLEYEEHMIRKSLDGRGTGIASSCTRTGECCNVPILFTVVPPS